MTVASGETIRKGDIMKLGYVKKIFFTAECNDEKRDVSICSCRKKRNMCMFLIFLFLERCLSNFFFHADTLKLVKTALTNVECSG